MGGSGKARIVELLEGMAALLEFHGANPFKCRAFETAARALAQVTEPIEALAAEPGRLEQLPGVGKSIAAFIREAATSGRVEEYERLRAQTPQGIFDLMRVPNLGPKKLRALYDGLGIKDLSELEAACRDGRVAALKGFGEKTAAKLLAGAEQVRKHTGKTLLPAALAAATPLLEAVRACPGVLRAEVAGSLRRRKEVVGDIDIVAAADPPDRVMEMFRNLPDVTEVIATGPTKTSIRLRSGMQADLRVVRDIEYPTALQYFTGSKEHNTLLRGRARRLGLRLNEYGVFRINPASKDEAAESDRLPVKDERELYRLLSLSEIPPELREAMGELDAAAEGALPQLVTMADYRGVLHCHSTWSDGTASIRDMALAACERYRLEYIAICDHSEAAAYARGVKRGDIPRQQAEIDALNAELEPKGIRILKSCECDILADGSLDYPDDVLASMDLVVASVHSRFSMGEAEMTNRLLRAIEHPYTTILGHISGRLLLEREGYAFDLEQVLRRAAECRTMIEINCDPHRLDLDWRWCRRAKELGVIFAVNPDAHSVEGLANIELGIWMARKGWLTKHDIINSLPLPRLVQRVAAIRKHKGA